MQDNSKTGSHLPDELLTAVRSVDPARTMEQRSFHVLADVRESGSEYAIFLDVPGVDEDDLNVNWEADELVVSGNREFDHDLEDAEQFIRLERPYGPFQYRTSFQRPVVASAITAKYKRGVLKIRIPKSLGGAQHHGPAN
jgi:HSP20 family protein